MAEVAHVIEDQKKVTGVLTIVDNTLTLARFVGTPALGFQLSGTWVGTITFECTMDGTNWGTLAVAPVGGGANVTTTTGNGQWYTYQAPFAAGRVRFSTATSGSVNVTIINRPASMS